MVAQSAHHHKFDKTEQQDVRNHSKNDQNENAFNKTHQHAAKTENAKITERENKRVKQKVQQR